MGRKVKLKLIFNGATAGIGICKEVFKKNLKIKSSFGAFVNQLNVFYDGDYKEVINLTILYLKKKKKE